jgi:hypothetical protein
MAIRRLNLEPTVRANLDARVASLETAVENINRNVSEIDVSLHNIADRLDREFSRVRDAMKPNYGIWVSLASAMILLCVAIGSAAYVPVWITTKNINDKAQSALDWQHDYQMGRIPSSAEGQIKKVQQNLKEIETQFRANDENRNIQFTEQQRKNNELQEALHELGAKMPGGMTGPYYNPHISAPVGQGSSENGD